MSQHYDGRGGCVAIQKEATLGTAITTDTTAIWVAPKFPFDPKKDENYTDRVGAQCDSYDAYSQVKSTPNVAFPMVLEAPPSDQLGWMLCAIFGSDTAANVESDSYTHTFSKRATGATMPSYTVIVDKSFAQFYFTSCQASRFRLSVAGNSPIVSTTLDLVGQDETSHSGMGSPSYPDLDPFVWDDIAFAIADSDDYTLAPGTKIESLEWDYNLNPEIQRGAGGSGKVTEVIPANITETCTVGLLIRSDYVTEFRNKYHNNTAINFQFRLRGDAISSSYYYQLERKIRNMRATVHPTEEMVAGLMRTTVTLKRFGNTSSDDSCVLTNLRTSAY